MSETFEAFESDHSSTRHFFKAPRILTLLTIVCFFGIFAGGMGPCGPASLSGVICRVALLPLGLATLITSAICSRRAAAHRRASNVHAEAVNSD
jgi:hypothetical protein